MRIRTLLCVLVFWFFLGVLACFGFSTQHAVGQQRSLRVVNVDTGLDYGGIQEAINAPETLNGHTMQVGYGVFQEHVVVNKSVSLVGESPYFSIIDGMRGGVVVDVVSGSVEIRRLGIRNGAIGLRLDHADNCRIVDNVLYDGSYGLRLYHSRNAFVADNRVSGYSYFGVELDSSGNSTLRGNWLSQNKYGFGVDGSSLLDFFNDIDDSNFVNGKPIRYLANQRDLTVDSSNLGDVGYLGFVNSSNIVVKDLEVQNSVQGVLFAYVANSSVSNVRVSDNWNGVYVAHSQNISVSDVKAGCNFDYGIKFFNSSGSHAFCNDADSNGWAGIGLFNSPHSVLDLNEASYATYDIHIVYTNDSLVTRNTAIPRSGGYSIALYYSYNNLIYRNTFQNSLIFTETRNGTWFTPINSWNNSVEGNFWTSYGGRDGDKDGIGDVAYKAGVNNSDYHPLMGRFWKFSIAFDNTEHCLSMVSNSTVSEVNLNSDDGTMAFAAIGQTNALGFCRVAAPEALIRALGDVELGFLVNGEEPLVIRKWSEGTSVYWYICFANRAAQDWSLLWLAVSGVLVFLIVFVAVMGVSRMRRKALK